MEFLNALFTLLGLGLEVDVLETHRDNVPMVASKIVPAVIEVLAVSAVAFVRDNYGCSTAQ